MKLIVMILWIQSILWATQPTVDIKDKIVQIWKQGDLDSAIASAHKLSLQSPDDTSIIKRYNAMLSQKERLDDLLNATSKAIEEKKYTEAQDLLDKAVLINSNYPVYLKVVERLEKAKESKLSYVIPDTWVKPEVPDLKVVEEFIDTGAITTAYNLLKQLYGELTPQEEEILKKQFDPYYAYPSDEVIKYFKGLNEVLYKAVDQKTKLSVEMEGYGATAAEMLNATDYKNVEMTKSASESLLKRRKNILAIQRELSEINIHLNQMDKQPDAKELKKKHEKMFEDLVQIASEEEGSTDSGIDAGHTIDGIWEIREDDVVEEVSSNAPIKSALALKIPFNKIEKSKKGRTFMYPFNADKVYFKVISDLGNDFFLLFYAKFNGDSKWGYQGTHLMKKINDSQYEMYSDRKDESFPWKFTLTLQDNSIFTMKEQFIQSNNSMVNLYKYQLHRDEKSSISSEIESKAKKYEELSEKYKKNSKHAILKHQQNQSKYNHNTSLYRGVMPRDIKNNNFKWKLSKVEIVRIGNYHLRFNGYQHEITHSAKDGWIKVWQLRWKDVPGPPQQEKILVGTYKWNLPSKTYKTDKRWDFGLSGRGLEEISWETNLPTLRGSGLANHFILKGLHFENRRKLIKQINTPIGSFVDMNVETLGQSAGIVDLKLNVGAGEVIVRNKFDLVPIDSKSVDTQDYIVSSETTLTDKEEFYKLQIQQLTEDINRYQQMMAKATTVDQKKHFSWLIMGKEADLQQQKDLLTEVKTGQFQHTVTKWDQYNANISADRFIKESQQYQNRVQMMDNIHNLSKKLWTQGNVNVEQWADRQLTAAISSGNDEDLKKIQQLMQDRYLQSFEKDQIDTELKQIAAEDLLKRAENIKFWSEIGVMAGSAGLTSMGAGTKYLHAVYSGVTESMSNGIAKGAVRAVSSLNTITMVAGSAYEGYNAVDPRTGKIAGLGGAAVNAGVTLAFVAGTHVAIKGVTKGCTVAKKAFDKFRDTIRYTQERHMSKILIKNYETNIQNFKELMRSGNTVAAKQQMTLIEVETRKLMANPNAKNILKYNGNHVTKQYYQYAERKIKDRVINDFKRRMEQNGWSKFELKEFRNAASGSSIGMDWDIGLIEREGMKLTKAGKKVSVSQFQKEAEKEFQKAYFHQTGYSAEASFANLTTSTHSEAFRDINILSNPENASKLYAGSTAKTVTDKAKYMLTNYSKGFATKTGKYVEASRGMAKEIRTKIIPNLSHSKNKLYLGDRIEYFNQLETVLQDFGEHKIGITQAERSVRNLTGKSLSDLPDYIGTSLRKAIRAK